MNLNIYKEKGMQRWHGAGG